MIWPSEVVKWYMAIMSRRYPDVPIFKGTPEITVTTTLVIPSVIFSIFLLAAPLFSCVIWLIYSLTNVLACIKGLTSKKPYLTYLGIYLIIQNVCTTFIALLAYGAFYHAYYHIHP